MGQRFACEPLMFTQQVAGLGVAEAVGEGVGVVGNMSAGLRVTILRRTV